MEKPTCGYLALQQIHPIPAALSPPLHLFLLPTTKGLLLIFQKMLVPSKRDVEYQMPLFGVVMGW
jgi:hypothetical protein